MSTAAETIVAIATPPGSGGVGIVRMSGPRAAQMAETVCARALAPRRAHHVRFRDAHGETIDDGIALYFAAPASYTGEDVVELQAHGSPAVLRQLVSRCCALGARMARPGEFSERAFLNGKLDLAQAEAVADLIAAGDARAARAARRALDGDFSRRVDTLADNTAFVEDLNLDSLSLLEIGVNVEDVRIDHDPGRPVGLVELTVGADSAEHLLESLAERGWTGHR